MKDAKHTTGPWVVKQIDIWPFGISIEPLVLQMPRWAYGTKDKNLDDVRSANSFPNNEKDAIIKAVATQEANAHLIAAAPDLLEALDQLVIEYDEADLAHDEPTSLTSAVNAARAAIAKAKGKTT